MNLEIVVSTTAAAVLLAGTALAQYAPHTGDMTPDAPNASRDPYSAAQADAAAAFNSPDAYGPSHPVTPRSPNSANAGVGSNTTAGAGPSSREAGRYGSDAAAVTPDASYDGSSRGSSGKTTGAGPATNEPR
jgi:hypothetical protein